MSAWLVLAPAAPKDAGVEWWYIAFWGLMIAAVYSAILLWALYDLLVKQTAMDAVTKVMWGFVVVFFVIGGVILYVLVVKMAGVTRVFRDTPFVLTPYDKLEKLARLRDLGAITEEEFQAKKRDLMDQL